jgi:hypothetical protein
MVYVLVAARACVHTLIFGRVFSKPGGKVLTLRILHGKLVSVLDNGTVPLSTTEFRDTMVSDYSLVYHESPSMP